MTNQRGISHHTQELLQRPIEGQIHFTDVAAEVASQNDQLWWRKTDFDAALTINLESSGLPELTRVPIGLRPWLTSYGLVLTDDLIRARQERLNNREPNSNKKPHPDLLAEGAKAIKAPIALANYAPRNQEHTANNGSNFYLAITDAGLEIYATPLQTLQGLEARHRIIALYEIPNKDHPEYNGNHEQFRSARVIRTRRHPEHLVPLFEYYNRDAVIAAKGAGTHPQIIPLDQRTGHFAFFDKFGNAKLELNHAGLTLVDKIGQRAMLIVKNAGKEQRFEAEVASDLRSAPLGRLAVWLNRSDHLDKTSDAGFVELGIRVNDNPSTSLDTTMFFLLKHLPDLDPATSEVQLVRQ